MKTHLSPIAAPRRSVTGSEPLGQIDTALGGGYAVVEHARSEEAEQRGSSHLMVSDPEELTLSSSEVGHPVF